MKLEVNGIEVECIIGDRAHERAVPQKITVDVKMEVDDSAAHSDCLADAVDYVTLADDIRGVLTAARCRMIERAAMLAARCAVGREHVKSAAVKVIKRGAVPGIGCASAEFCA